MKLGETTWRALRPDAQSFDEVRIVTVPRYQMSGLSGDEWRISATVQFLRKGVVRYETSFSSVETAAQLLYAEYVKAVEGGNAWLAGEGDTCDQEGCKSPATVTLWLKQTFCKDGHPHPLNWPTYRRFCEEHKQRGDCGLDDADANYTSTPPAEVKK